LETSILPAKRSAAVQPYLVQQNNAFEPITELYLAIFSAWCATARTKREPRKTQDKMNLYFRTELSLFCCS